MPPGREGLSENPVAIAQQLANASVPRWRQRVFGEVVTTARSASAKAMFFAAGLLSPPLMSDRRCTSVRPERCGHPMCGSVARRWTRRFEIDADARLSELPELIARLDRSLPARREWFGPFPDWAAVPEEEAAILWPMLLAQIALTLQGSARSPAALEYRVVATCEPSLFRVAMVATDPGLIARCVDEAAEILEGLRRRNPVDFDKLLPELIAFARRRVHRSKHDVDCGAARNGEFHIAGSANSV